MDKESYIFNKFKNSLNGDDGAVVGKWVYSKDLFVEGVHFRREWMSLTQIATKSMLVNISDAIAMNAVPKYALLGVSLPKDISVGEIDELTNGFLKIAREYGVQIIGGDTISDEKIVISITIISKTKNPIYRKGASNGDLLAFTGNLGDVKKEFEILENGGKISNDSKFYIPNLKDKFFYKVAKFINAAMDISDGLSKDLSRLLKVNSLGFKPLLKLSKDELCSGEEYEILFAFKPKFKDKILKIACKTNTKITIFGQCVELDENTKFINKCKEHHF
ncbi:thiamine-phosphate kinase [Campylobacter geochelonis]|uniref:thiamine-phosphate kinase n=1 Tax=Campylobacter geochelonis TaxID=1780362 RepID=UPI0007708A67|nr:thiamine-phosphate kinase [Campylobacter geochelonis]CZE50243.1 thiamine monophosphate kinase [Campylobacter geochelonis]